MEFHFKDVSSGKYFFRYAYHRGQFDVIIEQKKYHVFLNEIGEDYLKLLKDYDWEKIAVLIYDLKDEFDTKEEEINLRIENQKALDVFNEIIHRIQLKDDSYVKHIDNEMDRIKKDIDSFIQEADEMKKYARAAKRIGVISAQIEPQTENWKEISERFENKEELLKRNINRLDSYLQELQKEYEQALGKALEGLHLQTERDIFEELYFKSKEKAQIYFNRLQDVKDSGEKLKILQTSFDSLKSEIFSLKNKAKELSSKNRNLNSETNQSNEKIKELHDDITKKIDENKALKRENEKLEKQLLMAEDRDKEFALRIQELENQNVKLSKQVEKLQKKK